MWEAAMLAASQRVERLCVVVDFNRWQATGRARRSWRSSPWRNKMARLRLEHARRPTATTHAPDRAARRVPDGSGKPVAIVAHTSKGKGVSFMEDATNWHYRIPKAEEVAAAKRELGWRREERLRRRDHAARQGRCAVVLLSGDIGNKLFDKFNGARREPFPELRRRRGEHDGCSPPEWPSRAGPVVYTITPFTTTRCFEQIRVDACYHGAPVLIVGTGSGCRMPSSAPTHHSLEDMAILRTLAWHDGARPCDEVELRQRCCGPRFT